MTYGAEYDQVVVTNSIELLAMGIIPPSLDVVLQFAPKANDAFIVMTGTVAGKFTPVFPDPGPNLTWNPISYQNNAVTLSVM